MNEVKAIIKSIKDRNFNPLYFLMGDEPFYIDQISNTIAKSVLSEEEKGFNQTIVYGRDPSGISTCTSFYGIRCSVGYD